jgi:hypothetical protein
MEHEHESQIDSTAYAESFTSTVLSTAVEFEVQVRVSFSATMDFTFLGRSYTFLTPQPISSGNSSPRSFIARLTNFGAKPAFRAT